MNRVLNIALDARPLSGPRSGIRRYTESLLREFARRDCPHRFFLYSHQPVSAEFSLPSHWHIRHGKVKSAGLGTAFAQLTFPFWARKDEIDVFWSPRQHLPIFLPRKMRKVVTIHDMVWKRLSNTMRRGGHLVEALIMPATLRIADQVIAVSHFTLGEIRDLFPSIDINASVIYEASTLDSDLAANPCTLQGPYLLFVGSCEPRKNLPRLLRAYMDYRRCVANPWNLVIAGADQWGDFSLAGFLKENDLLSCVQSMRNVDDAVLSGLYRDAGACVMVSLYEGFGLPLIEAMQWGRPLITSSNSAMAEIAGDAALLVDPSDEASIAEALSRISQDCELRAKLSMASRRRSALFDWERAADMTLMLLTGATR